MTLVQPGYDLPEVGNPRLQGYINRFNEYRLRIVEEFEELNNGMQTDLQILQRMNSSSFDAEDRMLICQDKDERVKRVAELSRVMSCLQNNALPLLLVLVDRYQEIEMFEEKFHSLKPGLLEKFAEKQVRLYNLLEGFFEEIEKKL